MADLSGSWMKLDRTKHHLDAIDKCIKGHIRNESYGVFVETEPHTTPPKRIVRVRILKPIPLELSLLIGEWAHCARCVLDYLVHSVTDIPVNDERRMDIKFPIEPYLPQLEKSVEQGSLIGISYCHAARIHHSQPCYGRGIRDHPLMHLKHLNNSEKHRTITTVGALVGIKRIHVVTPDGATITVEPGAEMMNSGYRTGIIGDGVIDKDGAAVAEIQLPSPVDMHVRVEASIDVVFGPSCPWVEGRLVHGTLVRITNFVEKILRKF